jgi:hypothetical protein
MPSKPAPPPLSGLEICLHSMSIEQAHGILEKYLADHPERWDKGISQLADEAFDDACEKRAKNP